MTFISNWAKTIAIAAVVAAAVGSMLEQGLEAWEQGRLALTAGADWVRVGDGRLRIKQASPRSTPAADAPTYASKPAPGAPTYASKPAPGAPTYASKPAPGAPTYVLIGGLGSSLESFRFLQPVLARRVTTLAYDRAGNGLSDMPKFGRRDAAVAARELETLLATLALAPPYVLVGHSVGGLYARVLAHRHPEAVRAIVLLDPTMEDDWALSTPAAAAAEQHYFFRTVPLTAVAAFFGVRRAWRFVAGGPMLADHPAAAVDLRAAHWLGTSREAAALYDDFDQARAAAPPPGVQVDVISAGLPDSEDVRMVQGLHRRLAVAGGGRHTVVSDAEHNSLLDESQAERVGALILDSFLSTPAHMPASP